jgi:hypothetical protein
MPARKLRKHGIKHPRMYMALRRKGHSKQRAARISNAHVRRTKRTRRRKKR